MPPRGVTTPAIGFASDEGGQEPGSWSPCPKCPCQDSNLDYEIRNLAFYPLNYKGISLAGGRKKALYPLSYRDTNKKTRYDRVILYQYFKLITYFFKIPDIMSATSLPSPSVFTIEGGSLLVILLALYFPIGTAIVGAPRNFGTR